MYVSAKQWRVVIRAQKTQQSVYGVKQNVKLREDDDDHQLQECAKKSQHSKQVHFDSIVQIHIFHD